jgi:hypothetical protein
MWVGGDADGQHDTFSSPSQVFTPPRWTSIQFRGFLISAGFLYNYFVTVEDDKAVASDTVISQKA